MTANKTVCKHCGAIGQHYSTFCLKAPKKPLERVRRPRQQGKEALRWKAWRKQWIIDNPPDHRGYWTCYLQNTLMCPRVLDIGQLTLDHLIPKSRGLEFKYDPNNIRPCCVFCNGEKGSKIY